MIKDLLCQNRSWYRRVAGLLHVYVAWPLLMIKKLQPGKRLTVELKPCEEVCQQTGGCLVLFNVSEMILTRNSSRITHLPPAFLLCFSA